MLSRFVFTAPISSALSAGLIAAGTRHRHSSDLSGATGEALLEGLHNHEALGVPSNAGIDGADGFNLGTMHALLRALGSPHAGLPVVHVAGTKGKGSVVAMLSAIMQEAGYTVGAYTSPHLLLLRERISVNSQPISTAQFDTLVAGGLKDVRCKQDASLEAISHFEMMTALALRWFQRQQVDIALIEAGLGGARDATNVFDETQLKAAVITAVDLEHKVALGGSLASITEAKAGIMKKGRPVVLGRQPHPEAKRILCQRAAALSSMVFEEQAEVWPQRLMFTENTIAEECGIFLLNGECSNRIELPGLRLNLVGPAQHTNLVTATTAALVLRQQGFDRINVPTILGGLAKARLPGRFQVGRLKRSDGNSCWLVLDGAHTADSAQALASLLRQAFPEHAHPLALVVAMAADKDIPAVTAALRQSWPNVVAFTTVPIAGSTARSAPPGTLAAHWQAAGMQQSRPPRMRELIQASLSAAVHKAYAELGGSPDGVICVTGSMHAVAEALKEGLFV